MRQIAGFRCKGSISTILAIAVGWAELKEPSRVANVVELNPEKVLLVRCRGDFLLAHGADRFIRAVPVDSVGKRQMKHDVPFPEPRGCN